MRRWFILPLLLLILYVGLAIRAEPAVPHPFYANLPDRPLNIAHQGGEHLRPSNTMLSFENGVALGIDVLEMDIHSSADGVLVTIHDHTVDRTTNGTGRVNELSLAQLKALDAGHYWTDDDGATYPYRGKGVTIATLEEVFTAFPDMQMVIEIKQAEPSIVEPFCTLIAEYEMTNKVLVASFLQPVIDEFRVECPLVATSAARTDTIKFYILQLLRLQNLTSPNYAAFQVPEYFSGIKVVTPHFVKAAHSRGVKVEVWTINDSADISRFLALGVDGIITDRPDLMQEVSPTTPD